MQKFYRIFKGDKVIWMVFLILCVISVLEVFSASSFLTYGKDNYWGPIIKHGFFIFTGLVVMVGILYIPCKYFKIVTFPLYGLSLFFLLLVLCVGSATNDANRWFSLFGIQFQPSEIAKGSLVLVIAQILGALQTKDGADPKAYKWVLGMSAPIIALIFFENFSTAALISVVIFLMMFIGRIPMKQLGRMIGIAIIGGGLVLTWILTAPEVEENDSPQTHLTEQTAVAEKMKEEKKEKGFFSKLTHRRLTWKHRITKNSGDQVLAKDYDLDKDAQVAHANIAIVSSNVIGRGPGNSEERDFLSQAFSDFIYAIIIEETGLIGAIVVAGLYVIIFFRAGKIARNCANTFPAYLAMGIGLLLVIQAMFNMMVAVGIAPVTGQPLPLISKGGTSTIINCAYLGMLLSISRTAKKRVSAQ